MKRLVLMCVLFSLWTTAVPLTTAQNNSSSVAATQPIVQAILFYSPTCPHCHTVIDQHLPPLQEQYGEQLQILGVDVSKPVGQQLYQNAIAHFNLSSQRQGVPTLVVGETVLVGSVEIPQQFPQIIADGLLAGGIGWPEIPGLHESVPNLPPSASAVVAAPTAVGAAVGMPAEGVGVALGEIDTSSMTAEMAVASTPSGYALAWAIMAGMVGALLFVAWRLWQTRAAEGSWLTTAVAPLNTPFISMLVLAGLVVAAYLSYVEITHVAAVCGPVGECNIVQSSPYAQILGIPVAVLGLVNYLVVGALWAWQRARPQNRQTAVALLLLSLFGVFFSIYLTALELFVIHAVCLWCLTSAVVTTLIMLVVVDGLTKRPSPLAPELVG